MKWLRITKLALGVALALGGVATSSASASKFSLCLQVNVKLTGTYEDSKCMKEKAKGGYVLAVPDKKVETGVWCAKLDNGSMKGNFETSECKSEVFEKGAYILVNVSREEEAEPAEFAKLPPSNAFTGAAEGPATLAFGTTEIACSSSTNSGEITSMDSVGKVLVRYTGCQVSTAACSAKINSITGKAGEIALNPVKGEFGTVSASQAASGVGLLMSPETNTKFVALVATACSPELNVLGDVAGEVSPVSKLQDTLKLVFGGASGKDINSINVLGKEERPELETFGSRATEIVSYELTFSGKLEIT